MSHERYYLEDRLRVPFSRTIPSEPRPTGIGDNGVGGQDALGGPVLPVEAFQPDEVDQLARRGVVFPIETAEPQLATGMKDYLAVVNKDVQALPSVQKDIPSQG